MHSLVKHSLGFELFFWTFVQFFNLHGYFWKLTRIWYFQVKNSTNIFYRLFLKTYSLFLVKWTFFSKLNFILFFRNLWRLQRSPESTNCLLLRSLQNLLKIFILFSCIFAYASISSTVSWIIINQDHQFVLQHSFVALVDKFEYNQIKSQKHLICIGLVYRYLYTQLNNHFWLCKTICDKNSSK